MNRAEIMELVAGFWCSAVGFVVGVSAVAMSALDFAV